MSSKGATNGERHRRNDIVLPAVPARGDCILKVHTTSRAAGLAFWLGSPGMLLGSMLCASMLTIPAVFLAESQQTRAHSDELTLRVDDVRRRVERRLGAHEQMLRDSAERFALLGRPATGREWAAWDAGLAASPAFPEVDGVGYVEVLAAADRTALETEFEARGLFEQRIFPAGYRDHYGAITHHGTKTRDGSVAIGFDMYTRPALRQAMDRAAAGRHMVMTPLLAAADGGPLATEPAILAFFPVFAASTAPAGQQMSAAAPSGFIFLTLRVENLFEDIIAASSQPLFLRVAHHPSTGGGQTLYSNRAQAPPDRALRSARATIAHGDASWLIDVGTTADGLRGTAGVRWWWLGTTGSLASLGLLLLARGTTRPRPLPRPRDRVGDPVVRVRRFHRRGQEGGLPTDDTHAPGDGDSDRPLTESASRLEVLPHGRAPASKAVALDTAWRGVNDGLLLMDRRLRIVDVNPAFSRMSGFTHEELLGRTPRLFKCANGDASAYRDLARGLKRDGCWEGRSWNCRKSGGAFIATERTCALRSADNEISGYLAVFTDITQSVERERHLMNVVHFDALTGLLNRAHLRESLVASIATAHLAGTQLAVFYIDLDRFKIVNDRLGHGAGDELLRQVAQRLHGLAGSSDQVARASGDEFVLVLNDLLDESQAKDHAERVQARIRGTYTLESHKTVYVSASIGIALYPRGGTDPEQLLRQADRAMYTAKDEGRNRYAFFDVKTSQQVDAQRRRVRRIAHALENEELVLFYQPKVNMRTGAVVGAEALLRWNHPEEGLICPDQFLPFVAGTSQGAEIDRWVIGEALRQIEKLRSAGRGLPIAVNIDGAYLQQIEFLSQLGAQLEKHPNLPRHLLELEILESIALMDLDNIGRVIEQLHQLGVCVALDDFGTGYASLTYLKKLPTDTLKIDKSFIVGMFEDEYSLSLVQSIINLASTFERKVVAEGVETERHGIALVDMGCELGQGYGIARPLPADQFCTWIRAQEERPRVAAPGARNVVWLGLADAARSS